MSDPADPNVPHEPPIDAELLSDSDPTPEGIPPPSNDPAPATPDAPPQDSPAETDLSLSQPRQRLLTRLFPGRARRDQQLQALQSGYLDMLKTMQSISDHLEQQAQNQQQLAQALVHFPEAVDGIRGIGKATQQQTEALAHQTEVLDLVKSQLVSSARQEEQVIGTMNNLNQTLRVMDETSQETNSTISGLVDRSRESETHLHDLMERSEQRMARLTTFMGAVALLAIVFAAYAFISMQAAVRHAPEPAPATPATQPAEPAPPPEDPADPPAEAAGDADAIPADSTGLFDDAAEPMVEEDVAQAEETSAEPGTAVEEREAAVDAEVAEVAEIAEAAEVTESLEETAEDVPAPDADEAAPIEDAIDSTAITIEDLTDAAEAQAADAEPAATDNAESMDDATAEDAIPEDAIPGEPVPEEAPEEAVPEDLDRQDIDEAFPIDGVEEASADDGATTDEAVGSARPRRGAKGVVRRLFSILTDDDTEPGAETAELPAE